ncbi:MAG: tetratricopeptide repeat protein [Nitrospirae bacterium]|nr:tetratricopeptide repeat protein [Nitrospirota bacterium]
MSLVHEALKKVQEERSRRSTPRTHEPAFLASGGRTLPSPRRAVLLGGTLILFAVFAAAWRFGLFPSSGVKPPAAHPPIQAPVQTAGQGGPFRDQVGISDSRQTPPKAVVPEIPAESPKAKSSSAFDEGVERFNNREWDAALERFQAAREAGIQPARSWLYAGKIAGERGDLSKAEEAYRRALSSDPGLWEAANNLGALRRRENGPVPDGTTKSFSSTPVQGRSRWLTGFAERSNRYNSFPRRRTYRRRVCRAILQGCLLDRSGVAFARLKPCPTGRAFAIADGSCRATLQGCFCKAEASKA